jgi:hypothetical protein
MFGSERKQVEVEKLHHTEFHSNMELITEATIRKRTVVKLKLNNNTGMF